MPPGPLRPLFPFCRSQGPHPSLHVFLVRHTFPSADFMAHVGLQSRAYSLMVWPCRVGPVERGTCLLPVCTLHSILHTHTTPWRVGTLLAFCIRADPTMCGRVWGVHWTDLILSTLADLRLGFLAYKMGKVMISEDCYED